jgi:hypothetical protein
VLRRGLRRDAVPAGRKKMAVTLRISNPHDYVNHLFKRP